MNRKTYSLIALLGLTLAVPAQAANETSRSRANVNADLASHCQDATYRRNNATLCADAGVNVSANASPNAGGTVGAANASSNAAGSAGAASSGSGTTGSGSSV